MIAETQEKIDLQKIDKAEKLELIGNLEHEIKLQKDKNEYEKREMSKKAHEHQKKMQEGMKYMQFLD